MKDMCDYDYVIVGAGPAGVQMAYFLEKTRRKYIVYESQTKAASFFQTQPRNRQLLSINKKNNFYMEEEFNMRHDWNSLLSDDKEMKFTKYSEELYPHADDLHQYINDFADGFNLNIQYNTRVTGISKPGPLFKVTTSMSGKPMRQTHTARCVLMATGAVEENLHIPGLELADSYATYEMNKETYADKTLLVVGGGNSAFETADYLSDSAGIIHLAFNKKFQFAWDTHYVGDVRAVNNNILDMYLLKSLHAAFAHTLHKVEKTEDGQFLCTFEDVNTRWDVPGVLHFQLKYDKIISCMGWNYVKPEIFDKTIKLETVKNGRYPKLSNIWETGTENLFYIGAAMGAIDRKSASGFIHGFRYNIRTLHNILEERHFSKPLPSVTLRYESLDSIYKKIIHRLTLTDALYQMNEFLCDVVTFDSQGRTIYYTEIPMNHVMERAEFKEAKHLFVIYYSYGFDKFGKTNRSVEHVHAPDFRSNKCLAFLHPIIEYHTYGEYVDQTEWQDSLVVRYDEFTSNNYPQWDTTTVHNYIKFFFNDKLKWTEEKFNLIPVNDEELKQFFVPLTKEELSRIPEQYEPTECRPAQELLPREMMPKRQVHLRPTKEEMTKYGDMEIIMAEQLAELKKEMAMSQS